MSSINTSISSEMNCKYPSLPSLYLEDKRQSSSTRSFETSTLGSLPSELFVHCFSYCNWGDLSKIATVNSSWKTIVSDAASHGGLDAKWHLALSLLSGTNGLAPHPELAVQYLTELASSARYTPAMRKLSNCYLTGDGADYNQEKGIKYLEDAVDGDDTEAAHQLALIYEYGEYDVPVDVVLAAEWFLNAASNGHIEAMAEYAMCCELGCGVPQSDADALDWYTRAANAGHIEAHFSVGEIFEEAKGVPQSDEEACLWYYKAAVMGDDDAKKALLRLQDIARIVVPGWNAVLNE